MADTFIGAARSDFVIVCHVNIKHKLARDWSERGLLHCLAILGLGAVDRSDLKARWVQSAHFLLPLVPRRVALVS